MGQGVSRTDYEWVYTDEPHATRRKEIMAKYPQVKKLMGCDPNMKYKVTALILMQLIACYLVKDSSFLTIFIVSYCFGGVINHSLTLAIHEISHNLAFGHSKLLWNRWLGIWANLPLGIPMSISFKKYHLEHHKYQGDVDKDMDVPHELEAKLFTTTLLKFVWLLLQPVFYALRPLVVNPKPVTLLEIANTIIQVIFDIIIVYTMGWRSLIYLAFGTFTAMGLHPVAGHFISEHYMFVKGYETYSYYGRLNWITFNVGYHNEHHDFPSIPGCNLPKLKEMVPEYYDNLPCHNSWCKVLWEFIFNPDIGPYARIRRRRKERLENMNETPKNE
ncbi:DgyrCDS142 [Dimorphilus gyrociliatus]|uniref:sphingolipid 4-desaturase n=1 Tax=Dimorphilus gyrociliatus TaxID=2664684 RepID=A0A7I8V5F3_9ANNE|nr:DgyrCDS142 [Dimorphilus gyrociliatus]